MTAQKKHITLYRTIVAPDKIHEVKGKPGLVMQTSTCYMALQSWKLNPSYPPGFSQWGLKMQWLTIK